MTRAQTYTNDLLADDLVMQSSMNIHTPPQAVLHLPTLLTECQTQEFAADLFDRMRERLGAS